MNDESFLTRWARRKAEETEEARAALPADVQPEDASSVPPELPDPETLGLGSDFTVFMRPGVPDAVRRAALRRLWRVDPAFSELDGLVEYGGDYAAKFNAPGIVRTLWRVGRGMTEPEPEPEPEPKAEAVAEAEPAIEGTVAAEDISDAHPGAAKEDS